MNPNGGYVPTWRKFRDDWKWKDVHTRGAWLWMFLEANFKDNEPTPGLKKGELILPNLLTLAKEGGWKHHEQAKRFLNQCVKEHDILCQLCAGVVPKLCRITIVNYWKYSLPCAEIVPGLCQDGADLSIINKEKNIRKKNKREEVASLIAQIPLEKFRGKYPSLNIDEEFEAYQIHYLDKNNKDGKPNYLKWSDWNKAFHTWCKNALKWQAQDRVVVSAPVDREF